VLERYFGREKALAVTQVLEYQGHRLDSLISAPGLALDGLVFRHRLADLKIRQG
jgi:hypothetical protein